MNQLIERLIAESTICQGHPQIDGSYFDKEKFAELIVKECLGICKEKEQANLYGVREVENTIKEHFGVE
jgi:hypothetical protein